MKKITTLLTLGTLVLGLTSFVISSGGMIGQTGSPGEGTCAACHGGGGGQTSVSITGNPAFTGNQYVPGQTYTVTITVSNGSFSKFGFDCEILNSSNANAGNMSAAFAGVQFANAGSKKNATHTGISSSGVWSFEWVAPTSGNATIYAAGNAVDGTGSTGSDKAGHTSLALTALGTDIRKESVLSTEITLYPNPSANEISLNYQLLNEGKVKIDLYNLSGQVVATILDEEQQSGVHVVNKALPLDLAAGIYIAKLEMNGKVSAQKMFIKR
ncbi:MAG: hypothetical protein K0S32_4423 [Bacteroidetes bacterium]|jgi:hypothetical protein|nr:hypothetical protein [Bacteroidota bacterium]